MIKAKLLAFSVAIALAACGGKKPQPAPANTGDTTTTTPAEDERDAEGRCCCELPSDPATYQLADGTLCHEDNHGVCVALTQCADSGTGGP